MGSGMRSYEQARELAGTTEVASHAGGRTRRIRYEGNDDGSVSAVLMGTPVVTFRPDHVVIRTGGYVTATTFDGIATALQVQRGHTWCGTFKRVPYVFQMRMSEGMRVDYAGALVAAGAYETPLAPSRRLAGKGKDGP